MYITPQICLLGRTNQTINYQNALKRHEYRIQMPLARSSVYEASGNSFAIHTLAEQCDLLLLPGGGDIDPSFYRQTNCGSSNIDAPLDYVQLLFLDAFVKARKPVIGICKGMQLLNIYFGGTLRQNLPEDSLHIHAYAEHDRSHPVLPAASPSCRPDIRYLSPQSFLFGSMVVNSAHHQDVAVPGKNLCVLQTATDDVIETICHRTLPIIGVQWHPERLYIDGHDQLHPIIQELL